MNMQSGKANCVASVGDDWNRALQSTVFALAAPLPTTFHPAGSEIYAQGGEANCLYQVKFGCVRIHRLLADGRRQISAFHLPDEIFGFEEDAKHHFFAEAISATATTVFRFATAMDFSRELLPLALHGLMRAQKHLLVLGRQNAAERVAAFLVDMAERQGGFDRFELPMSRADIADYLGLSIETVSRTFTKLKEQGIIRLPTLRSVEIEKWNVLAEMSE